MAQAQERWRSIAFAAFLLATSASAAPPPAQATAVKALHGLERDIERRFPRAAQIDPGAVAALVASGAAPVLVDVREADEFAVSHLSNAVRLDPDASPDQARVLLGASVRNRVIVLYCAVGYRSSRMTERIATTLRAAGATRVVSMRGGVFAWRNAGRPVVNATGPTPFVHPYDAQRRRFLVRQDLVATRAVAP